MQKIKYLKVWEKGKSKTELGVRGKPAKSKAGVDQLKTGTALGEKRGQVT